MHNLYGHDVHVAQESSVPAVMNLQFYCVMLII